MAESMKCPPPPFATHEDIRKAYELLAEFNPLHSPDPETPHPDPEIYPKGLWRFEILLSETSSLEIVNCHNIYSAAPEHHEWVADYRNWGGSDRQWEHVGRYYTVDEMGAAVREWMATYKAEHPA